MIKINLTNLENEAIDAINKLSNNKEELRKEMIKFLKDTHWPDTLEYGEILEFINDFFVVYPKPF